MIASFNHIKIIMFLKRIARSFSGASRSGRTSKTFKVSDRQEDEDIQGLRNVDYKDMRSKVIDEYNMALKKINQQYKQKLSLKKEKSKEGTVAEEEAQEQFSQFYTHYSTAADNAQGQMSRKLKQIKEEEKTNTVKIYLAENIKEESRNSSPIYESPPGQFYIPKGFIIKKLYMCTEKEAKGAADPTKQLLMVGVDKDEDHCLFLNKLIQEFEIKNVVTMVPPDLPYFIKTEDSFLAEWKKFLEDNNYARKSKFYINPKPKNIEDICLHSHHFQLVRTALGSSSSFIDTHYALLQQNDISKQFQYAPLLSPLCMQSVDNIYMADYPVFEERKMLADSLSLQQLRDLFQEHLANIRKLNLNFRAQWLFPQDILRKKLSSVVKIARQVVLGNKGRTMLLCPAEMTELIGIEWQLGLKDMSPTYFNDKGEMILDYYSGTQKITTEQTFVEHVQKLVILDMIMEPVITRYFVKYRSFPFLCHHTIGGKQNIGKIFIVWMHYYNTYYQSLNEKRLESEDQERLRDRYMKQFQDPTNFT